MVLLPDICFRCDRERRHHPHYRNSIACVDQKEGLGPALLPYHTAQEAHGRIVAGRWLEKTLLRLKDSVGANTTRRTSIQVRRIHAGRQSIESRRLRLTVYDQDLQSMARGQASGNKKRPCRIGERGARAVRERVESIRGWVGLGRGNSKSQLRVRPHPLVPVSAPRESLSDCIIASY